MKLLPIIGFDRYIRRHWLDLALAVAAGEADRGELVAMLEREIAGVEARSKTMIILNRMWLTPHPTLADFARAGVEIYRAGKNIDTLPLHWGMALASHPFFASMADCIGRLLKLHGECTALQINRRLKELLGDRASILRAAEAVLQTMVEWQAIRPMDGRKRLFVPGRIATNISTPVSIWVLEACVRAGGRPLGLGESSNLLFPLKLPPLRETDIHRQSRLRMSVSGSGAASVALSESA